MVKIEFDIVCDKGETKLTDVLAPDQQILLLAKDEFWNLENAGNYSARAYFNRDFPILEFL